MKEKLAASLILLRVALLLGLSMDKGVFLSVGGGASVTAVPFVPSGGSDAPSAATSGSSFTEITHKSRLSLHLMKDRKVTSEIRK